MSQFFDIIPKFEKDLQQKEPIAKIHTGTTYNGLPYNLKTAETLPA
jgi:hypothetical protein